MPSIVTTRTAFADASSRTIRIADRAARPDRPNTPSRRAILAGTAGIAGLVLLALTGCATGASSTTIPEAAATGTPVQGGRLRVARPAASAADTLDSASSLSAYEYSVPSTTGS